MWVGAGASSHAPRLACSSPSMCLWFGSLLYSLYTGIHWGRSHFPVGQTEVPRHEVTCPKSHSQKVAEAEVKAKVQVTFLFCLGARSNFFFFLAYLQVSVILDMVLPSAHFVRQAQPSESFLPGQHEGLGVEFVMQRSASLCGLCL